MYICTQFTLERLALFHCRDYHLGMDYNRCKCIIINHLRSSTSECVHLSNGILIEFTCFPATHDHSLVEASEFVPLVRSSFSSILLTITQLIA